MNLWEYEHDYYCNIQNFHDGSCLKYETWDDFLSEWQESDRNYNLLFRWDWKTIEGPGLQRTYSLELFFMLQRKGIFRPVLIERISVHEEESVIDFLKPHWENLKSLWKPFSGI